MDEKTLRMMLGEEAVAEPGLRHVVCQVDSYEQQLEEKVARARHVLREAVALGPATPGYSDAPPTLEIHPSQPSHFRQRADLWVRSDVNEALPGAVLHYAMAPATKGVVGATDGTQRLGSTPGKAVRLNGFPVASLRVNELMDGLMGALNHAPPGSTLRSRLYEARFLTSLRGAGPPLITLIYHRKLDADWETAAQQLAATLSCSIVGRSRGQKIVIGQDWVDEELQLRNCTGVDDANSTTGSIIADTLTPRSFYYRHAENGFSQPNAAVNERMVDFALSCCTTTTASGDGGGEGSLDFKQCDLLELYCGNANFTVPLSKKFRSVLATELAGPSVELARVNLRANHCNNATMGQLDELVKQRSHADWGSDLSSGQLPAAVLPRISTLTTLLVDPPRSGLDATVIDIARRFFRYVVYISCNPTTMLRDIRALAAEGSETTTVGKQVQPRVIRFATFDQFPYTTHLECGVLLELMPISASSPHSEVCTAATRFDSDSRLPIEPESQPQLQLTPAENFSRDKRGRTALHLAASKGSAEGVASVLRADNHPAFVDAADRDGCSALMRACEPGHLEAVRLLLAASAAANIADKWGRTALHCAALKGRSSVVSLLLNHRADATNVYPLANLLDKHRRSPLHYAAFSAQGSAEMIDMLVCAKSDLALRDEYAQTPLDRAVSSGRVVAVTALVAAGADLSAVDKHGRTPLHCAVSVRDNVSIVSALLSNAREAPTGELAGNGSEDVRESDLGPTAVAMVNQRDKNGRTALFVAASNGFVNVLEVLIHEGNADVNISDNAGVSPLSAATAKAPVPAVKALMEAGGLLDTQDRDGCTALHHAALHGKDGIIATLLAGGADGTILSHNGIAFHDIAPNSPGAAQGN